MTFWIDSKNVLPGEKRFTQRSRLFVGNLPLDMSEEDFRKLFLKFGEISEIFVNSSKGFGFVRLVRDWFLSFGKWFSSIYLCVTYRTQELMQRRPSGNWTAIQ